MSLSVSLLMGALALPRIAMAAPRAPATMNIHWVHDKLTGKVAMDFSAGSDEFALVSRQYCGQYAAENTIDWDAFSNSPLTMAVDQDGIGTITYAGQSFFTNNTDCNGKWNGETAILDCTKPYSGPLVPALPALGSSACMENAQGIAFLSPVAKISAADIHLKKREARSVQQRAVKEALTNPALKSEKREPQVTPSCFFTSCTVTDEDVAPSDDNLSVQISPTFNCGGGCVPGNGCCSVAETEGTSQDISFSVTAQITEWISGGFSVGESYSTGSTLSCAGQEGQNVCIWTNVPHQGYNVQNAQCNSCGGDTSREARARLQSPKLSDGAYCVRGTCRTQGERYFS